jgi:uncharacterized protein
MKKKLFQNKVIVKKSNIHGYGVFAEKTIKKGEIVEECHVLLTEFEDDDFMDYYFDAQDKNAIILGYGSIYNHSDSPNAAVTFSADYSAATFKARRDIKKGEEILISYGKEWFDSRDMKSKY